MWREIFHMHGSGIFLNTYLFKRKIKKVAARIFFFLCLAAFAVVGFIVTVEMRITPILRDFSAAKAKNAATLIINETIYNEIAANPTDYSDIITVERDGAGNVSALKTDILKVGLIKTHVTAASAKSLDSLSETELSVPLGNIVSNSAFMSGKGPRIKIKLLRVGAVSATVSNEFTDAGINQTNHRIMLNINATVSVSVPFSTVCEDITSSVCIAETVIVGKVPEAYTRVTYGPDSVVGDVMDFGAQTQLDEPLND